MAQIFINVVICFFFNLVASSHVGRVSSSPSGFSLKLIHRDSPLSPLYQPNLSDLERFKQNVDISRSRASFYDQQWSRNRMESSASSFQKDVIRLPLKYYEPIFTVEIGLGTPVVNRTLLFDTGSRITWTQCRPCTKCFRQNQPLFDMKSSSSYRAMPKDNKFAKEFNCTNKYEYCLYEVVYYTGQSSKGLVSLEDFTFQTASTVSSKVRGLVFGCGTNNIGKYGSTYAVTGILGMNRQPVSFVRQLGGLIKSRFSYCLPTMENGTKQSYLRFGDEAVIRRTTKSQSSPFMKLRDASNYILNLTDISIGGQRLGLKGGTFPRGCIIDSGSSISLIQGNAYSAAVESLKRYFAKFKNVKRKYGISSLKGILCYSYPRGFTNFPNMTFHFEGADLHVPPENLFTIQTTRFCLEIIALKSVTLLGAYQQQNMRFVYDLDKDMLSFAKEDCSKDGA